MNLTALQELRDRIAKASGADRDLDWAIWFHTATEPADHSTDNWPPYTASVDAALALVETCLPGWRWAVQSVVLGADDRNHIPWCGLGGPYYSGCFEQCTGRGTTPPLAIIDALLAALIKHPPAGRRALAKSEEG